jgi:hypothetical protein
MSSYNWPENFIQAAEKQQDAAIARHCTIG